jgi:hypothetical protein
MARLDGDLPRDVPVAHKAGTSDVVNGVAIATNDIGLIRLPDGRELAIAVFITDSTDDQPTRDKIVARIARAAYDEARNGSHSIKYPSAQKSLPVLHTSTLEATVTHVINAEDSAHPAGRPTLFVSQILSHFNLILDNRKGMLHLQPTPDKPTIRSLRAGLKATSH